MYVSTLLVWLGDVLIVWYYGAHFFLHFPLQPNAHHMAQTAMEQDERLIKVILRVYVFSKLLICVFLHWDL